MKTKPFVSLLLALLLVLSLPAAAFADMDGPSVSEIEAYVSNPLGAPLYKSVWNPGKGEREIERTGTVVPNGTKLILRGKYYQTFDDLEDNGEYYFTEYGDDKGYVLFGDITFNQPAITPKAAWKFTKPDHAVVINPDGVPMFSGPDEGYEKLSAVIPYGTEVTFEYANGETNEYQDASWLCGWCYTTYQGIAGWVETPQYGNSYNFGYRKPGESLVVEDTPLYQTLDVRSAWDMNPERPLLTVPAGAFVTYDLIYRGAKTIFGFVTYQGKTGWMLVSDGFNGPGTERVIQKSDGYLMVVDPDGAPCYAAPGRRDQKTGDTVPAWQVLRFDYNGLVDDSEYDEGGELIGEDLCWRWYRVNWNGKQVWVGNLRYSDDAVLHEFYGISNEQVLSEAGMLLYAEPDPDAAILGTIPQGEIVQCEFYWTEDNNDVHWNYVAWNGQFGWVRWVGEDDHDIFKSVDNDRWTEESKLKILLPEAMMEALGAVAPDEIVTAATETTAAPATEPAAAESAPPTAAVKASPHAIIIGCVCTAAVLALVAAVTIALIRKKKAEA